MLVCEDLSCGASWGAVVCAKLEMGLVRDVDACQTTGCRVQGVAACHLVVNSSCWGGGGAEDVIHTRAAEHGRWIYFFICVNSRS